MRGLKTIAAVAMMMAGTSSAFAGMYTDDLSRCLVEKSSAGEKSTLVLWMFVAMSRNPAVASLAKVTDEDVETQNRAAGELFVRLLTETCASQAKSAIRYEGPLAIQGAFQVLGQVAARDLMASPEVVKVLSGLEKYMDAGKLEALSK